METSRIRKSRASSSNEARRYRQQGHDDALLFALSIGLNEDYKNDAKAKKDVIDLSGDAHSVKSGKKKWQIFLYGLNRFENDHFFRVMNGMGQLLIDCIKSFPETYEEYQLSKAEAKERLRPNMVAFAEKLKDKIKLSAFIGKAMFNGGEVNYLTIYEKNKFHVFWGKEVVEIMVNNLEITNSQARQTGQFPEQKVIFKFEGTNLAELEMRNDSPIHYREIRFNMVKPKAMKLLFSKITLSKKYNDNVILYGEAMKHFGHWINKKVEKISDNNLNDDNVKEKINKKVQSPYLSPFEMINVPLYESVGCGEAMTADLIAQEMISIRKDSVSGGAKYFVLRTRGDSMNKAGINDGDLVLCRKNYHPEEGNKVVAIINGDDAIIKEYHRENGCVILKPCSTNPVHKPLKFKTNEEIKIQGVVVRVLDKNE